MSRMLGSLYGVKDYRDIHPLHGQNELARRRNRAREDATWRREIAADVDPPSWITERQWRDCAESECNEYTLPVGYDGTWRVG